MHPVLIPHSVSPSFTGTVGASWQLPWPHAWSLFASPDGCLVSSPACQLRLVDYEYSSYGHPAFDLANAALMNGFTSIQEEAFLRRYAAACVASAGPVTGTAPACVVAGEPWKVVLARHALIKSLFGLCEALWALAMDATSPLPFAATWTTHESFAAYGNAYLADAARDLAAPTTQQHIALLAAHALATAPVGGPGLDREL